MIFNTLIFKHCHGSYGINQTIMWKLHERKRMLRTIPRFVQRKRGNRARSKREAQSPCCLLLALRSRSISLTLTMEAVRASQNIGNFYRATWVIFQNLRSKKRNNIQYSTPRLIRTKREADHSHSPNVEVKNSWSSVSTHDLRTA